MVWIWLSGCHRFTHCGSRSATPVSERNAVRQPTASPARGNWSCCCIGRTSSIGNDSGQAAHANPAGSCGRRFFGDPFHTVPPRIGYGQLRQWLVPPIWGDGICNAAHGPSADRIGCPRLGQKDRRWAVVASQPLGSSRFCDMWSVQQCDRAQSSDNWERGDGQDAGMDVWTRCIGSAVALYRTDSKKVAYLRQVGCHTCTP